MNKLAYYEQDYTRENIIPETELLPEIKFVYKPINIIQGANFTDKIIKSNGIQGSADVTLELLSQHLVSWDLAKTDGTIVNCNDVKSLSRVDNRVILKIASIIRGDRSTPEEDTKIIEKELKNL